MGLNISKGNMYDWVTHTMNFVKGKCFHDCSYCFVKRWGQLNKVRLDENEFKTDLGSGNFIFIGSSCDMFAHDIPLDWIVRILEYCKKFPANQYLFQTKNPKRMVSLIDSMPKKSVACITLESNVHYPKVMQRSPTPHDRVIAAAFLRMPLYVTIEPVMDFDTGPLASMIYHLSPVQVNIGADSGGNKLPEPSKEKILDLIAAIDGFTTVKRKKNLARLMK